MDKKTEMLFVICPHCEEQVIDAGRNVTCDLCGKGQLPSHDDPDFEGCGVEDCPECSEEER